MNNGKETQVVMLVTENKSKLQFNELNELFNLTHLESSNQGYKAQHLYFLSDEKIKEGDYCYNSETKEIWQAEILVNYIDKRYNTKIIATTDDKLRVDSTVRNSNELDLNYGKVLSIIARPSDALITKYVEEYNSGNVIDKVLVEYTTNSIRDYGKFDIDSYENKEVLKVAPENTITIRPIVKTWDDIYNEFKEFETVHRTRDSILKWLKQNYNVPTKKIK